MNRLSLDVEPSSLDRLNALNAFVEKNYNAESGTISLSLIKNLFPKLLDSLSIANEFAIELIKAEAALDDADGISK